ncbi:MAG: long-chain fatty acid--CoA ligase [Xanthobacteraceae bacterium]
MDLAYAIERHAAFTPRKLAIRDSERDITYAEFAERIRTACRRLVALGVKAGDVVAFLGLNHPELLALLFACIRRGAILLPLNWRLAPLEHARVLADADPRAIVVGTEFLGHADILRETVTAPAWFSLGAAPEGWREWDRIEETESLEEAAEAASDRPALLCYTSGSTGSPKGVVLTQGALFWNAVNSAHMHDLTSADRVLTTLPMFHVGGLNIQTVPALHAGASVVLHAKFDPGAALEAIERHRITLAVFVPAQLTAMMEHPHWETADLGSLRVLTTGSTIVSEQFVRRVHRRGVTLTQVYGSTETCPIASYVRREEAERKAGSAGLPALHCELRVVDHMGRDMPAGEDGEIIVRGPNVMREYWNAPDLTAEAIRDGWYHSGDIGRFDDEGYLHVIARKHDMIISGGENIYPAEVEAVLADCPDIFEACVVGQPDERWGEAAVAAVVRKPGARISEPQVMALFEGRIAHFKRPRAVFFVEMLPRNALGKVQREEVKAMLASVVAA